MEIREMAQEQGWSVDPHAFPEVMYITGTLESEGLDTSSEYMVAAFHGDQVRGVAIPQKIEGQWAYFMTLYGHGGETLIFRLMDQKDGQVYGLSNEVDFASGTHLGNVKVPYLWSMEVAEPVEPIVKERVTKEKVKKSATKISISEQVRLFPNPTLGRVTIDLGGLEGVSAIQVFDLLGNPLITKELEGRVAKHVEMDLSQLPVGIYLVRVTAQGATVTKKVVRR